MGRGVVQRREKAVITLKGFDISPPRAAQKRLQKCKQFHVKQKWEKMSFMHLNETQKAKKDTTQTFHVDALDGKGLTWQFEMTTEGQRVDYKLDTGAQVNLLSYDIYQRLYPRSLLHPTRSRLFAYGAESPIAVRGQCVCSVQLPQGELGNCDFMSYHRNSKWQRCR